jgi:hypothetical protein
LCTERWKIRRLGKWLLTYEFGLVADDKTKQVHKKSFVRYMKELELHEKKAHVV